MWQLVCTAVTLSGVLLWEVATQEAPLHSYGMPKTYVCSTEFEYVGSTVWRSQTCTSICIHRLYLHKPTTRRILSLLR